MRPVVDLPGKAQGVQGRPFVGSGMRVCIVRHFYYPEELSTRRQAEYFAGLGFEVDVICSRRSKSDALRERVNDVNIYRMPIAHRRGGVARYVYEYLAFFVMSTVLLTRLHLARRYDVIQVNTMPDFLVFVAALPRLLGARVVVFMQEPVPEAWMAKYGLDTKLKRLGYHVLVRFEQLALAFADRALTVTEQLKQAYVDRGARAEKITAILNVPDTRLYESFPAASAAQDDSFDLVCHGSIEERYGQDVAIRAVAILKGEIPGLRLNILGWGEYESQLRRLAAELGLQEQVKFWGFVPLEEMIARIHRAHVGIVPMRRNVYSDLVHTNKMFEFIAVGKPIIITRTKAVEEYFADSCLLFFESGDSYDLARAIREVYHDPLRRETLAANAWRAFQSYRWELERAKCLKVFEDVTGKIAEWA